MPRRAFHTWQRAAREPLPAAPPPPSAASRRPGSLAQRLFPTAEGDGDARGDGAEEGASSKDDAGYGEFVRSVGGDGSAGRSATEGGGGRATAGALVAGAEAGAAGGTEARAESPVRVPALTDHGGGDEEEGDASSSTADSARDDSHDPEPIDNVALLSAVAVGSRLAVYWPADGKYHPCVVTRRDRRGEIHTLRYDEDGVEEKIDLTWENFCVRDEYDGTPAAREGDVEEGGAAGPASAEEAGKSGVAAVALPSDIDEDNSEDTNDEDGSWSLDGGDAGTPTASSATPATLRADLAIPYARARAAAIATETNGDETLLAAVAVGARLAVYWPADGQYHTCVVTRRDPGGAIHTLRYEEEGVAETIDLTWEIFLPLRRERTHTTGGGCTRALARRRPG